MTAPNPTIPAAANPLDAALQQRILAAREHSLTWMRTLQQEDEPAGVTRISAAHDATVWPGMLLPGTYNAVMARDLLGDIAPMPLTQRECLADWLQQQRLADGRFRIRGMTDDTVYKKPKLADTWEYIDFHVSNYSLGAIQALCPARAATLDFAMPWLAPLHLKAWLSERDLRDPWQEGNNIVNLGSFLLRLADENPQTHDAVQEALDILFAWHDRLQEPATGFWGVGQGSDATALLHAMAGSMHNFHLWYATGRKLPYQDRALDYALSRPAEIHSACIDVDLVDLLVHGHQALDYRRRDIEVWLRTLLPKLLDFQQADGGFSDEPARVGAPPRRQDGWVGGYAEPQGFSNTFSTWFRWIAIAMVANCLWPDWQPFAGGWKFRRMVGIGYAKLATSHSRGSA